MGSLTEEPLLGLATYSSGPPKSATAKGGSPATAGVCHLNSDRTLRQQHPLTYASWRAMKERCRADGFVLDTRWLDFENFLADVGPRPKKDFTLDRIDPT